MTLGFKGLMKAEKVCVVTKKVQNGTGDEEATETVPV